MSSNLKQQQQQQQQSYFLNLNKIFKKLFN